MDLVHSLRDLQKKFLQLFELQIRSGHELLTSLPGQIGGETPALREFHEKKTDTGGGTIEL